MNAQCNLCESMPPDAKRQFIDFEQGIISVDCRLCGDYVILQDADYELSALEPQSRLMISFWARENSIRGRFRNIISSDRPGSFARGIRISEILSMMESSNVSDRLSRALLNLSLLAPNPGQRASIGINERFAIYSRDKIEMEYMIESLVNSRLIDSFSSGSQEKLIRLTPVGWQKIELMAALRSESDRVFVAMMFDASTDDVWVGGIFPGIVNSGYAPFRVDKSEHNDKICDVIIREIRRSRFLVADVTGHRAGVYFEAGFAMGIGMPVIWTCNETDLGRCHFDTRQYSHIVWSTPEELCKRLQIRIEATIGRGPR